MKITCPESSCAREDVEVSEDGIIEFHYPSPKKTLDPEHPCRLSKAKYVVSEVREPQPEEHAERKFGWHPGYNAKI